MEFDIPSFLYSISDNPLHWTFILIISFALWRLLMLIYVIGTSSGGIRYINVERFPIKMDTCHNPFSFDLNIQKTSYSGVECTFNSDKDCYILALWGVPVYQLFELLNKNWHDVKNSLITHVHDEKFSSKCIYSNDPLLLAAGEKKVMEFKPRWDIDSAALEPGTTYMREIYPFVVIMILQKDSDCRQNFVVAMANVVHIPDNLLKLHAQLLGQYVKLSSGPVGTIKKIFVSSPATSTGGDETFDLCLACYHRAVSPVFLPCRHACVCSVCFEFCENCPICRGPAAFYFELLGVPKR